MSDMNKFRLQFADYEWLLRLDGYTDAQIEEVKDTIREDWNDPERVKFWRGFIAERSSFRKELLHMSHGINERIKSNIARKKAAASTDATSR